MFECTTHNNYGLTPVRTLSVVSREASCNARKVQECEIPLFEAQMHSYGIVLFNIFSSLSTKF